MFEIEKAEVIMGEENAKSKFKFELVTFGVTPEKQIVAMLSPDCLSSIRDPHNVKLLKDSMLAFVKVLDEMVTFAEGLKVMHDKEQKGVDSAAQLD